MTTELDDDRAFDLELELRGLERQGPAIGHLLRWTLLERTERSRQRGPRARLDAARPLGRPDQDPIVLARTDPLGRQDLLAGLRIELTREGYDLDPVERVAQIIEQLRLGPHAAALSNLGRGELRRREGTTDAQCEPVRREGMRD